MRSSTLALALGATFFGAVSGAVIQVGAPCILGTDNVCLNPDVLTLADVNANVVLACTNGTYQALLCPSGEACQGGQCLVLIAAPQSTTATVTTTPSSTPTPVVGVGVPCVLGVAADVCLNTAVLSLTDPNANVILRCVDGFYASELCSTGEGCQNGQCVTLLGEQNPSGPASTDTTGPTLTAPISSPNTDAPTSEPTTNTNTNTGDTDPISRVPNSSTISGPVSTNTDGSIQSGPVSTVPTGDTDPIGRGPVSTALSYVPYPVTTTTTEYVVLSACTNDVWNYATICNIYPVCDVCTKPPTYVYKTKMSGADTIIYPFCEACEEATECVVPTPSGCNTCHEATITVDCGKTTPGVVVPTTTCAASATIVYQAPVSTVPVVVPACTTCGVAAACTTCGSSGSSSTTTPKPMPVFISGVESVGVKSGFFVSVVIAGVIAVLF